MPVIAAGAEESAAFVALALLAAYEHGRRCAAERQLEQLRLEGAAK